MNMVVCGISIKSVCIVSPCSIEVSRVLCRFNELSCSNGLCHLLPRSEVILCRFKITVALIFLSCITLVNAA